MSFSTLARSRRGFLGCALTAVALIGITHPVSAAPIVDQFYTGVTTDLAEFRLGVGADGLAVGTVEIGSPTAAFPMPCFDAGVLLLSDSIGVSRGSLGAGAERTVTDPVSGQPRILRMSGQVNDDGTATGSASISAVGPNDDGVVCAPRSFGWAAVARTSTEAPLPGATYRGTMVAGQTFAGLLSGGTASFRVTADGQGLTNFALTPEQECASTDFGSLIAPLTDGAVSLAEEGKVSTAIPFVGRYRVAVAGSTALGAFYIDRGATGCLPVAGTFVATGVAATPAATPAPAAPTLVPFPVAPTGTFAAPPVYSAGPARLAQAVFQGSLIQLEIALAGVEAGGAWAQTPGGTFQLYVAGAPASVSAGFTTAFPGGFSSPTALTLVHK